MTIVSVQPTMDCEPPGSAISAHARSRSATGPEDYDESERSIRGFVDVCMDHGFPPTLFIHPQVAHYHEDLFRELEADGVCLGLHLHPYKFDEEYREDLGAYTADRQREMIAAATEAWEDAIGHHPRYFRSGIYSTSDVTMPVLVDLGYTGGSMSRPGSVKPAVAAVWAGAPLDPHRGHDAFRLLPGDLDFVNAPITVDPTRPVEANYESLYLSAMEEEDFDAGADQYDLAAVVEHTLDRIQREEPAYPALVPNTHNNMAFGEEGHASRANAETVFRTIRDACEGTDLDPDGEGLSAFVDRFQ